MLVNNAANDQRHEWQDVTPDYWDERMAINLRPMFFAIQSVAPQMKRLGGGSIVNFGSISWKNAMGGMPAYTTAKAAVHGLTRGFARDLGQDGIRVNTVLPGWVMTERQKKLWLDEAAEKLLDQVQCLKGRLQPEDLARMVLFLASDDARMCSAQEFTVDGGLGMSDAAPAVGCEGRSRRRAAVVGARPGDLLDRHQGQEAEPLSARRRRDAELGHAGHHRLGDRAAEQAWLRRRTGARHRRGDARSVHAHVQRCDIETDKPETA